MNLYQVFVKEIIHKINYAAEILLCIFRKIFKSSMMKPALADYIIPKIYNCRKLYLLTYFFSMILTSAIIRGLTSYCEFEIYQTLTLSSYSPVMNLFTLLIPMLTLDSFSKVSQQYDSSDYKCGADKIEDFPCSGPRIAAYIRVSSTKQAKEGVSLDVQKDEIMEMKRKINPSKIYWYQDAGKTGTTFDDRKIKNIQKLAESGYIDELWVTQIDRIGRECLKLLIYCLKLCEDGVVIRTPLKQYQLGELTDLLGLFLQAYGAEEENRKRAERVVASKARNFKMKIWNKPIPLGYEKKGDWIVKQHDWTPLILDVYSLFMVHKKIRRVCLEINNKYELIIGDQVLSTYHIKRFLSDTVYMGKPGHLGQIVTDPSLRYIDDESFSQTRLILESIKTRHMRKGDDLKELVDMYGISVFAFLNKIELHHSKCGGKLVRNGTRIIDGIKRFTYLCKNCREQFWVPSKSQLSHIYNVKQKNSIIQTRKNASNNDCVRAQDNNQKSLINSQLPDFFNKV